jgi:Tol biopolymer transport system component
MALAAGTRFGPYEIADAIGRGGMGEVYRATDTTLEREVAIKVLPESFATDTDRVARFEQEAKTLAALNHPNIAQIYGLERSDGKTALVMELVEGPTLADRIAEGPIRLDDALTIAMQIAEGLDAAHTKGIVHRDLKPANIKVRHDGTVKLLDFGIAKALDPEVRTISGSQSPLLTTPVTQTGIILGTAAYMSPEQARGLFIDQRTDVWAFGCVLYEMLTGQPAFGGEDVTVTLARVVDRDSDLSALPKDVPPAVRRTIELCLQKNPKERLHAMGDVRLGLRGAFETSARHQARTDAATAAATGRGWRPLTAVASALILAAIAGTAVWALKPAAPAPIARFVDVLPAGRELTRPGNASLAVSKDGTRIVYVANRELYLRDIGDWEARAIPGTDVDPVSPVFSPDGQWIAFWAGFDGQIKKIAVSGGAPVSLAPAEVPYGRMSWTGDDQIVWSQSTGIMTVPANGGTATSLVASEQGSAISPQILPGGKAVLFHSGSELVVRSLESGERKVLFAGINATYISTGHIVYGLGDVLLAVPFDLDTLETVGGSVPLVEGVRTNNMMQYDVAPAGTLVYMPGGATNTERTVALVDRDGTIKRLNLPPKEYTSPRISPDGQTLIVESVERGGDVLWAYDMSGERAIQQLTFDGSNHKPGWTPDGNQIAFSSDRDGTMSLYRMPADGSGVAERLTTAEAGTSHWLGSWTPDGKTLVYNVQRVLATDWDIEALSLDDGTTEVLHDTPGMGYFGAELSPDGHWLAFGIGETSANIDIYVEPFPPTGARSRISQSGGYWPLWSPTGDELIYRPISVTSEVTLRTVEITTTPSIRFSNEQTHPVRGFTVISYYRDYDIMPDGERLLLVLPYNEDPSRPAARPQINVVLNWFDEVRARVPRP